MHMRKRMVVCMLFITLIVTSVNLLAQSDDQLIHHNINFATVPKTDSVPVLDGLLNDACWQKGTLLTNFILTAGESGKLAKYQTKAYLLYDDTHLYVAFQCFEPDVGSMKTTSKMWDDLDILYDDRVEIFLDINHDHRSYYELAVNSAGIQFDQVGFNRLQGSKTCDMDPSKNVFWRARTSIGEKEWIAEIGIDVTSLGVQKIEEGMTWGLNLTRVRQPDAEKGDEFFKRVPHGEAEYSAWTQVNDYIRETISNFHSPIEFGDMVFNDPGFTIKKIALKSTTYYMGPNGYPSQFGKNPLIIQTETDKGKLKEALLKVSVEPPSVGKWESVQEFKFNANKPIQTSYFIPEDLENKIVIQLLDPKTEKQLYRTSYIDMAAPFIEFDLEPLYTRNPQKLNPVSFRLLTDNEVKSQNKLVLDFLNQKTGELIVSETIEDLSSSGELTPVFDVNQLRGLPGGNYVIDSKLVNKRTGDLSVQFKQNLTKFNNELPSKFEVVEGNYHYGGITDYAIHIRYPFSTEFVFWRSASYIPFWDVDQAIMTNEFIECWGKGNQGCCEPMQDRENRYSSVRLIENSPARAVVHWRYALSDPHYKIYANEWVDEYYTLYPDGVTIREVNLWPNSDTVHEMFEVLLAKPPGIRTEQLYDEEFATLSTLDGKGNSNKYFYKHEDEFKEFLKKSKDFIVEVHFKDRLHPFTVFSLTDELMPGVTRKRVTACSRIIGTADRRGHWPASRYQIDGYNIAGLDVPNHGNIGNIQADIDPKNQPTTWTFLIGVAEEGSTRQYEYAKSWLYPAEIKMTNKQFVSQGYDQSQRAYVIQANEPSKLCSFTIETKTNDIVNPVFVIDNPTKQVKTVQIGDRKLDADAYAVGQSKDQKTVIFLNTRIEGVQTLTIEFE